MTALVPVDIADYTFPDGSMNARQYHAWLWAQIPKDVTGERLERISAIIDGLTVKFMADGMAEEPWPKTSGGLDRLFG